MKILFLSRWFPFPADNGSKLRINNLLRGLNQHHDVTLISFIDQPNVNLDAPEIRPLCSDVYVVPWKEFNPTSWQARLGILSLKPRSILDTFSREMAGKIATVLKSHTYDLVIASQLPMAAYYPYFHNVPAIFEELEIGLFYSQVFSPEKKMRYRQALTWFKLRSYVSKLLGSFQACTVASEPERQLLLRNVPGYKKPIELIPNCLDLSEYKTAQTKKNPQTLIFTGSFRYHANYEAMLWFVGEVFPLILQKIPDAQLTITGDHANLPLPSLKNITLTGYVDNIKALIASSAISIAPLLDGGGTRLKILESMALDTPIVATSKGAEGLDIENGKHLLVANTAREFAESVVHLLKDDDLRKTLSINASSLVHNQYNWQKVLPRYMNLADAVVSQSQV